MLDKRYELMFLIGLLGRPVISFNPFPQDPWLYSQNFFSTRFSFNLQYLTSRSPVTGRSSEDQTLYLQVNSVQIFIGHHLLTKEIPSDLGRVDPTTGSPTIGTLVTPTHDISKGFIGLYFFGLPFLLQRNTTFQFSMDSVKFWFRFSTTPSSIPR